MKFVFVAAAATILMTQFAIAAETNGVQRASVDNSEFW
ncbi:MAG: hypothetical protein RIR97_973 [Pseudomonadota bacterium]